jgi:hypothetical protein
MSFIIAIRNVGFSSGARVFAAARAALKNEQWVRLNAQ